MRSLKLASLVLLSGSVFTGIACSGSSDEPAGDGDGDTGVGAMSGDGDTPTTGGVPGDGDGSGGVPGDGDGDSACLSTAAATAGGEPMIDDFEDGTAEILENDGRVGAWAHGHWITPAGQDPVFDGGFLTAECVEDAWCNTDWDMATPWGQWASIDVGLGLWDANGVNCYDASIYTGIKFKAKSMAADNSLRVQLRTPDANADTGETYQGTEIPLTTEWADYEVPFSSITQPSWSTVAAPLNPAQLVSISFVVRTREDQLDDAMMIVGEKLVPYNIQLDDVAFY